ncbi:MAG: DMT family transporter [Saprospiraceae bacterium]|nr:DMT family transporter [Saprospiraceae bacterium]
MRRAYLEMHLAVLLYGVTAILGKVISLAAIPLVWWRVLLTSISLLFLVHVGRLFQQVPRRLVVRYALIGCLVALHWITFFLSIKLANASIALVALATQSCFTAVLEPAILRRPVRPYELVLGVLVVPAMLLIVNEVPTGMHAGIWVGLASALLIALFTCFNKRLIGGATPLQITFIELSSAAIFITFLLPFLHVGAINGPLLPSGMDWLYLAILVLLCTTLGWLLVLRALRHLSAFSSNLVANLEPVYGIVLAWLILGEHRELTGGFYAGAAVILAIVLINPFLSRRDANRRTAYEEVEIP